MAEDLQDVRAKISRQAHEELTALSQATGREMGELLRQAVEIFIAGERQKAHEYSLFLRMMRPKGNSGDDTGHAST